MLAQGGKFSSTEQISWVVIPISTHSKSQIFPSMIKKILFGIIFFGGFLTNSLAQEFLQFPSSDYSVLNGEVPEVVTTISVTTPAEAKYKLSLLYPEYIPLNASEVKALKRLDYTPPTSITPQQQLSFDKKNPLLTISFQPFIRKGNNWLRLVSCKIVAEPLQATLLTNKSVAAAPSLLATAQSSRYANNSVLSSGKWVKIRVDKEGVYQITSSQLSSMGFSDISKVKLYGYGGQILPQVFSFTGDNALIDDLKEVPLYRRSNSLLFFSEGVTSWSWQTNKWVHENNPYSAYAYYFLTEGSSPEAFSTLEEVSTANTTLTAVTSRALYEKDAYSWFGGGREFVDSYDYAYGNKQSYTIKTPGIVANTSATVDVAFTASDVSNSTVVNVQFGSTDLGSITLSNYSDYESAKWALRNFSTTALGESNDFTLTTTKDRAARLDFIRISYQRTLSATDNGYSFVPNTSGNTALQVANANANTRIWRLGNSSSAIAEVAGSLSGNTYTANISAPTRKYVIVDIAADYPTPTVVGQIPNQNLHADTAVDMVILLPPSAKFKAQAERLATVHRAEGLRVRLVNAGDIYNEFSSGTPDAMAYRRYLKMLYDRAETTDDMPKYLLLFGASLWDNRHVTPSTKSLSTDDYLLAYEKNTSSSTSNLTLGTLNSYVSDDLFGLMDDAEGRIPETELLDIAIGRIPCATLTQAKTLVDKTLAYLENTETGFWKNTISILGDDGDNNLHMTGAESIARQVHATTDSTFVVKKYYWDAYKRTSTATGNTFPEVTKMLQEQMTKGSLIFNYMGHGSPHQLSHSKLLTTSDFATYLSAGAPLWVFASCEITPYDQNEEDLGRISLFNTAGGAVSLLCAARAVYASPNTALNVAFMKHALTVGNTLGEAIRLAKRDMVSNSQDRSVNKMKYNLLGDPAIALHRPTNGIVVDSINGQHVSTFSAQQISAGSVLRISGHIEKNSAIATDFKGTITGSIFDRDQTIVCVNNSGATTAMRYNDRGNSIYQGTDSVRNGRFTLNAIVPRNISYTNDRGRAFLYAVNEDKSEEYNGANSQFYFNGTSSTLLDTIGPKLFVYLNSPDFPNGGRVNSSALFGATISDDSGISVSSGIGHGLELIIDGDYTNSILLNDYFSYDFGSYQSGTIAYTLSNLSAGKHTLLFRAWDVNDNSTTATLDFVVGEVEEYDVQATNNMATTSTAFVVSYPTDVTPTAITLDIYDLGGRLMWRKSLATTTKGYATTSWDLTAFDTAPVPAGVYIYKASITTESELHETESKKMIVVKQ